MAHSSLRWDQRMLLHFRTSRYTCPNRTQTEHLIDSIQKRCSIATTTTATVSFLAFFRISVFVLWRRGRGITTNDTQRATMTHGIWFSVYSQKICRVCLLRGTIVLVLVLVFRIYSENCYTVKFKIEFRAITGKRIPMHIWPLNNHPRLQHIYLYNPWSHSDDRKIIPRHCEGLESILLRNVLML